MEASCKENASENTGQHYDGLFEHCLTTSDVGDLNNLVVTPNKDAAKYFHLATVGGTNSLLQLEDEEGKSWRFSYLNDKQSFVLTTGWSNYVKEKQLSVGDFVFFQRHLTDSTRLFIGYRRCDDGAAAPGDSDCLLPHPTSSETLVLTEKLKEVETPPRQSITRSEPVLVISCCNSQDSEETYFISYIFKELRLRGFTPLRYDLTRSTVPGNSEMLYSPHVGIMVISMNYACSRECLDGVVAIMDHLKANDLMLIPVFFKVNPSDVRNQSGPFERAFVELWNSLQEPQVQRWREAMTRLTFINGFQYMKGGEVMLAKNIVRDAYLLLSAETNRNLKGMGSHLKSIGSLLHCAQSSSPHIVGLWGMAGIGKTTISKEILRKRAKKYNVCYFLSDFHLMCQTKGLGHLRDEFFSKIFGEEMVFIDACDIKLSFLRDRLQDKRVLIVLDGVSNARDVEVLVGGFGWFSGRHTIIVTSTDRQVLVQCNAKEIYEIPNLSESQSIWLCSHYATEQNWKGQRSLILKLVKYASGNPLALRVLGLSIQKQCIDVEKHLRRLRQHPPIEFQDAFRRSFYKQSDNEKNIFLDLACFFRGENKDHVLNILDGCGFLSDLGIYGLIDESLISLVCNRIEMPNIFQDMGRFVVCQEHVEAGKRSRLWDPNDIIDVLTNNSGTEANEGIYLDAAGLTFELSPTVFERMYRLRLFKLHCPSSEEHWQIYLPQGLYSLPDELRLLHWERYPLESLPQKFSPKNLVELNMPYSNITKLWKGTKNLEKLKRIILSHSRQFTELPKLSKARNLEHIDLEGCTSLVEVNSSILHHQKLTFLSLKDCSHLRIMPTTVHLESLEVLNLSGCSELEDLHDFSPNLKELYLAGTAIGEVPSSLADLTKLVSLDLENCKNLQYLPPGISSLKAMVTLKLFGCSNLKSHQTLDALLVTFDLESGNRLEHLPPIAVVTHSAKHPASSMNLSTMVDMAAPYKRKRSKRVIKTGILSLRKRDPERTVSSSTNLSEVLLASASTSVNDCSYTSFYGFHVLPERPDQPECQYYMKTGDCKDGNVCKFHHPKDRKLQTPDLHLPGLSLSLGASSSSKLVKASTEKLKQHKNTSSMVSHGNSSFVSDTAQTTFGRDTIDLGEEMSATIIDGAAIRIQTYFRSYMCRRQHLITRQGIVLIQAHWRGYRVRKNCRNSNLSMELVK